MTRRFVASPFPRVAISPSDESQLHDLMSSLITAGQERYTSFIENDRRKMNSQQWKLVRSRESARVYIEKPGSNNAQSSKDLPLLLCAGTTTGQLEDFMFGVLNPTLEVMMIKSSYVDGISGGAVLANVEDPTMEAPFRSLVLKWMEIDFSLHTANLIKRRDYIYAEATDIITLSNGERVGYQLLHSIQFPQTHKLPNRIRGNLSVCNFFRQINDNVIEMFATGITDPMGGLERRLMVPHMANIFLSTLKCTHCGQMKKLAWMLEKQYDKFRSLGTPKKEAQCVTCHIPISERKIGTTNNTCKLCFGRVCHSCTIYRKISFVTPDTQLSKRKVSFCMSCLAQVQQLDASQAARAQIVKMHAMDCLTSSATSETSNSDKCKEEED